MHPISTWAQLMQAQAEYQLIKQVQPYKTNLSGLLKAVRKGSC